MNKVLLNSRNIDRSYTSSMNVTESCYLIEVRTIFEWHKPHKKLSKTIWQFHTSYHLKLYKKSTAPGYLSLSSLSNHISGS